MFHDISDTIVAIATPRGSGGIGIIRISGKNAYFIARKLSNKININIGLNYTSFFDRDAYIIDNGLILFFKKPKSFTGDDVIEVHAHGNDLILDALIFRCIELGARIAKNGEFSFRAYLNNKIDLIQAEAINSIIKSNSIISNRFIFKSLSGKFSDYINSILEKLIALKIQLEASIEFPDHVEFVFSTFYSELYLIYNLYMNFFNRLVLDDFLNASLSIVILGEVNAGKSSLFNCLLNKSRSIVSDVPGTTRDFVDSDFFLNGFKFKLVDTAGFNDTSIDFLEKISIECTINQAKLANILIFVTDITDKFDFIDSCKFNTILQTCLNKIKVIVVRNKIDLVKLNKKILHHETYVEIFLSVKSNYGVDLLLKELSDFYSKINNDLFFVNKRQFDLLFLIKLKFSELILNDEKFNLSLDLYSYNINIIIDTLSELLGIDVNDNILNEIFSKFCVGK